MNIPSPMTNVDPPVTNDEGQPVTNRIQTVDQARSLWVRLRDADRVSVGAMAKTQAMFDNAPPYDQAKLQEVGQGWRANFNDGLPKATLDASLASYMDLVTADQSLVKLTLKWPNREQKQEWEDIMSSEMSSEIRSWSSFMFRYLFIAHYMRLHGVGIAYFPDCHDWRWKTTSLQYFKIPRDTESSEDQIQYACMKTYMQPAELMIYVDNADYAQREGWNIEAIKSALMTSTPPYPDTDNWMEWQMKYKNYDYYTSGETAPSVPIIYEWMQENDGTYSLYVFAEGGTQAPMPNRDQFLCKKENYFNSAEEAYIFFCDGIGSNATFHSIRGLGNAMYNAFQQRMRLRCQQVDIAGLGVMLQPESKEAMENFQCTPAGPFMFVDPSLKPVAMTYPPLSANLQPTIQDLDATIARVSGQYTSSSLLDNNTEMTRTQVLAGLDQSANLSVTSINMFYTKLDKLLREVVRRWVRKGYMRTDPGGHQIHNWKQRCMDRGVPAMALDLVDVARTRASRVIGYGSPAARRRALEELTPIVPQYDARGQAIWKRKMTAAIVGNWELADELCPDSALPARPPVDAAIAASQNSILIMKASLLMNPATQMTAEAMNVPVEPNEIREVHLEIHTGKIAEYVQMFDQAGQDPSLYEQIVPPISTLYEHSVETLDGYNGPDAPMYNQILQQCGEILVNGTRHLAKEQERQSAEGEQQGGQQENPEQQKVAAEMFRRTVEFQQRLEFSRMQFEQKMAQNAALAQQKRQIDDAKGAQSVLLKAQSASVQARINRGTGGE